MVFFMPFKSKHDLRPGYFSNAKIPIEIVEYLVKVAKSKERMTWAELVRNIVDSWIAMHRARGNVE